MRWHGGCRRKHKTNPSFPTTTKSPLPAIDKIFHQTLPSSIPSFSQEEVVQINNNNYVTTLTRRGCFWYLGCFTSCRFDFTATRLKVSQVMSMMQLMHQQKYQVELNGSMNNFSKTSKKSYKLAHIDTALVQTWGNVNTFGELFSCRISSKHWLRSMSGTREV